MKSLRSLFIPFAALALFFVHCAVGCLAAGSYYVFNAMATVMPTAPLALAAENSLGTLYGTHIIQRALELVFTKFPRLGLFSFGFRDLDGQVAGMNLGQTAKSRLHSISSIGNFGDAAQAFSQTDVDVTLRNFRQIYHAFTPAEINSTELPLIDAAAMPMAIGLASGMTRNIAGLVCRAKFKQTVNSKAPYLAVASGWDYDNTILPMQEYANERGMPEFGRYFLVNSAVNSALLGDELIVAEKNNPANLQAIQQGRLPQVSGFEFDVFPSLPNTDGNLIGFAGVPGALGYVARPPRDPRQVMPNVNVPFVYNFVQDKLTGFTVMVQQWIDTDLKAHTRLIWLDGLAVGDSRNLIRLVDGAIPGSANTIVGLTAINPGYGYRDAAGDYTAPTVTISGGGGANGAATAAISTKGAVTGLTIGNAGSGYTSEPTVALAVSGGKADGEAEVVPSIAGLY